jgi:hypothetical protein
VNFFTLGARESPPLLGSGRAADHSAIALPLPGISEHRKARCSLGRLEVLPFEMSFLEGAAPR